MMRIFTYFLSLASFLFFFSPTSYGKKILNGINFQNGQWALIGVPVHNYHKLPVQEELGTFIITDGQFLQELKKDWDLEMTFEDKCDYHYALKLYQNKKLVNTIFLNLLCGYVSVDGISYHLDPSQFETFRGNARRIPWSRITFSDMNLLQKTIDKLDGTPDVYWYEDVAQYAYEGFFMLNIPELPWNVDLDSLKTIVSQKIAEKTGTSEFHLAEHFFLIDGDMMSIRYFVNCNEPLARQLVKYQYLPWRTHLKGPESSIPILALGIDEKEFRQLLRQ